jgi:hypothetical protein
MARDRLENPQLSQCDMNEVVSLGDFSELYRARRRWGRGAAGS